MNDSAAVREAIAAGVDCCGENRVQELVKKLDEHAYDGAPVHFIGALQRNKVRQVVGQVDVIESVDRRELLADINAEAAKRGIVQDILLEINAGGEKQKVRLPAEGIPPDRGRNGRLSRRSRARIDDGAADRQEKGR